MVTPTAPAVLAKIFAAMADVGNEKRKNIDPRINALVGAVAQDSQGPSKRQRVLGTAPGWVSGADLDTAGEGIFRSFAEGRSRTTEGLSLDQRVAPVMEHFGSVFEIFMRTCTEAQSLAVQLGAKDTEIAILKRDLRASKQTSEDDRKRMIAEFTKEKEAVDEAAQKLVDEASVNYTLVGFENFRIQAMKDFPEVDWSGKHYIHGLVPQPTCTSLLGNDNNFESPPNMPRGRVSSSSIEKEIQTRKASTPRKESSPNKKKKVESNEEIGVESGPNAEKSKLQETSKQNPNGVIEYPDPDFSDFDKERRENCFAANQVWAVYAGKDVMPRCYALIKKIDPVGFRVKTAWLEAELEWALKGLPVACGRFKPGKSEDITDSLMFSHKVSIDKTLSKKGSYVIYPRLGQTWALFKDMDIKCTNGKQQSSKYELVTIVSQFRQRRGIRVSYLRKVRGFLSIFQTTIRNGRGTFQVPKSELFRFSHQIPSFKMTGEERGGVPRGSFELDPAALPTDLDQSY